MQRSDGAILRQAAQLVRQGWTQNTIDGCAVGHIHFAQRGDFGHDYSQGGGGRDDCDCHRPSVWVLRALGLSPIPSTVTSPEVKAVEAWNDREGQTAENVATALEFAALLADQEQQVHEDQDQEARTQSLCESGVPSYRVLERD